MMGVVGVSRGRRALVRLCDDGLVGRFMWRMRDLWGGLKCHLEEFDIAPI